jgi:hypothetical protein
MATTTIHTFKVGDKVTFPPDAGIKQSLIGMVFTVEEVPAGRKRNYRVRGANGGRYSVRPGEMIPAGDAPTMRPFVPLEFYNEGEIVTVRPGRSGQLDPGQPMVVLKDSGTSVNVTSVGGGDQGRYWRVPRGQLIRRDLEWLAERLVEMS